MYVFMVVILSYALTNVQRDHVYHHDGSPDVYKTILLPKKTT